MDSLSAAEDDDQFADSEEWIAAQARQLFRARRDGDAKAIEVGMFHFEHYLTLTLRRHLRRGDPPWEDKARWIDGLSRVRAEYPSAGRLRIQADATWVIGQEHWYDDPFEFELELCRRTGAFRRYVFRFGDRRPLAAKGMGREVVIPPRDGWEFEFERKRADQATAADPPGE
jgi:hypothetical protein